MSAARVVDGELIGGRYRAVRILGEGGMGEVWQARNETTDRDFAIKFLHARMARDPLIMQRFLQEAKAAGCLRHPAIADVYDMGYHDTVSGDRVPFIVMELLHGEALDELLQRDKKLPMPLAVTIGKACAEALAVAHKAGIVHRDLKPANVFMHVTGAGELTPKLLDFGVSKLVDADAESLTVTGVVVGTPTYMSPEQYRSETTIDGRADIWSLGVLLCRVVAGRHPFRGTRMETLAGEITSDAPVSLEGLGLPPDYRAIVARCLEKDRDKRYATAREVADALDALSAATTGATEPSVQTLIVEKRLSRRWPLVIGAAVGGSALVVLAWVTLHSSKAPEKVQPAEATFASASLPPPATTQSSTPSAAEPVATAAPSTTHAAPKHTASARPSVGAPKPSNAWRSPGF